MAQILIVEDSIYQRAQIRKALEVDGHELVEAANGLEGLDAVAASAPDCILLDIIMPEMGGLEFLQNLKDQGTGTPVIMLTADIQESTRQRCLALGATAVINKPLKGDELVNAVRQILGSPGGQGRDEGEEEVA